MIIIRNLFCPVYCIHITLGGDKERPWEETKKIIDKKISIVAPEEANKKYISEGKQWWRAQKEEETKEYFEIMKGLNNDIIGTNLRGTALEAHKKKTKVRTKYKTNKTANNEL